MINFSCYLLLGEFDKVLETFMPNYDIPGYASSLSTVSVTFSEIIIDIAERKISVHCNITQSYDLVRNFIDGNGVTIIATTDLPTSSPQGRQEWEITGTGTIAVLQQLVWPLFCKYGILCRNLHMAQMCNWKMFFKSETEQNSQNSVFLKQHCIPVQNFVHSVDLSTSENCLPWGFDKIAFRMPTFMEVLLKILWHQRHIQNSVKHVWWSVFVKLMNN